MNIVFMMYLANTVDIIDTVLGTIIVPSTFLLIAFFLAMFLEFDFIKYGTYTDNIINFIKKYKFVYLSLFCFWILLPSKNIMYNAIAFNIDMEETENLTPLQQKALKNISAFLDIQIGKMEIEKYRPV